MSEVSCGNVKTFLRIAGSTREEISNRIVNTSVAWPVPMWIYSPDIDDHKLASR